MAGPDEDAALGDESGGAERELVGAEQRGDHDVAAGLDAHRRPEPGRGRASRSRRGRACVSASPISHGMPAFLIDERGLAPVPPSPPEMWTTSARPLTTPAAIVPTPSDATSFTETSASRVRLLEVEDELREVLDRVDVVMGRGGDQRDAGNRVPQPGDLVGHLLAGELAALAGLRALRHLDLELAGEREVLGRHSEAARMRSA